MSRADSIVTGGEEKGHHHHGDALSAGGRIMQNTVTVIDTTFGMGGPMVSEFMVVYEARFARLRRETKANYDSEQEM